MTAERVFIIGGTGNIGKTLVQELISKDVAITLFSRDPSKVATLFPTGDIRVIEGDLKDVSSLQQELQGHTRLFILMYPYMLPMDQLKGTIGRYAYEAGVKQIVDISSITATFSWRSSMIGDVHILAEKAILDIPNRGKVVTLRPGRFMSNVFIAEGVTADNKILGTQAEDDIEGWISPDDIGIICARILTEDVEKHGDAVYELIGDNITPVQRAHILSEALGKDIQYKKLTSLEKYKQLIKLGRPHRMAYEFSALSADGKISPGVSILLDRNPETFQEYIFKNKHLL